MLWDFVHHAFMQEVKNPKHHVCLALGSNLGDRLGHLRAAKAALAPYVEIQAVSRIYETGPAYASDQPAFLNATLWGATSLEPMALLYTLKDIEIELGRLPTYHYGPRAIDIDIVAYDDLVMHTPELTLPHALMQERAFVLRPMADCVPDWRHPTLGRTVLEMLAALHDAAMVQDSGESL